MFEMNDIIAELLEHGPFSELNLAKKIEIVKMGRPQPDLPDLKMISKERDRTYKRQFCSGTYQRYDWLTGSFETNRLYCWPCLLFASEKGPWNEGGFNSITYLTTACDKHQSAMTHLTAHTNLQIFKSKLIDCVLNKENEITNNLYNKQVKENRNVLRRLIDITVFVCKQESIFIENNEANESSINSKYVEQIEFLANYDPLLANQLKIVTPFKCISADTHNDLIEATVNVITETIEAEIAKTNFVTISLYETSEVMNKSKLATVIRYIDNDGKCQERFLHFTDVSSYRTAEGLFFRHINKIITDLDCARKLIAFTFDGGTIMGSHMPNLLTLIKDRYPRVKFVHSNCERLDIILTKSTIFREECQRFFIPLNAISRFFNKSICHINAFNKFMETNFPNVVQPTEWNFNENLISNVKNYRSYLIEFFSSIEDKASDWNSEDVCEALAFVNFLTKFDTKFLLIIFHKMFINIETLSDILLDKNVNITHCIDKINEYYLYLQKIKEESFQEIWIEAVTPDELELKDEYEPRQKRFKDSDHHFKYLYIFNDIIDTIIIQVKLRFESLNYLSFLALLDSNHFDRYNQVFPEDLWNLVKDLYVPLFDIYRLKSELKVFYTFQEFKKNSIKDIYQYLKRCNLQDMYKQIYRLIELLLTFPLITASDENNFSALRRINSYLNTTKGETPLNTLAILSIERDLLLKMKNLSEEEFYEKIIEKFIEKKNRTEFLYK